MEGAPMRIQDYFEDMKQIESGDHLVLLYRDHQAEIPVAAYIAASMMRNERCMYITGDADTARMIQALNELIDAETCMRTGQLILLDKSEAYAKDNEFIPDKMIALLQEATRTAVKDGYSGLAVTGEVSWVLDYSDGKERIIEYEWKLNEQIFDRFKMTALCRYNLDKFSPAMIRSIIELHPYIYYNGEVNENPFYIPPEGYRENKMDAYQVATWLENISTYTKDKSRFNTAIERKEREYEELFNRIQDAIVLSEVDLDRQDIVVKKINQAAAKMLGDSSEGIVGESITAFDSGSGFYELAIEAPDGFIMNQESSLMTRDGSTVPVELSSRIYKEDGKRFILTIAKDISLRKNYVEGILLTISNFLEIHDLYTKGHSENVAQIARRIAVAMGLDMELVQLSYWSGLVHDIGKILIPDEVLNKPGKLNDAEYAIIKKHPVWAYEAIHQNRELEDIARIVRHHHERWDGMGYPDGISGEEIPLVAQILGVADAYEAMTSQRSYKPARSKEEAIQELKACSGHQFSPRIAEVFIQTLTTKNEFSVHLDER